MPGIKQILISKKLKSKEYTSEHWEIKPESPNKTI